jgi:excisionase family DNA binding protein
MASNDPDPAGERWLGAQEAARYLGVHRSTLSVAVHRGTLVPDWTTPGGHLRFGQETLDRFKTFLERSAVTSDERLVEPLHVLTDITSALGANTAASEICEAAIQRILGALIGIDAAAVVLVNRQTDPPRLEPMTQAGFSEAFIRELQDLYAGGIELATSHVLHTIRPELVSDTECQPLCIGSRRLIRIGGFRAFALFPLARGRQSIGVLALASAAPRTFTTSDRLFLTALSSELSLAITLDRHLSLTGGLIRAAMDQTAGAELTDGTSVTRLLGLRDIFINQADAEDVCALGYDDSGALETNSQRLCALAREAMDMRTFLSRTWRVRGTIHTGMAVGVPLYDDDVGVAVLWRGRRRWSPADYSLLMVFAGACALATGHIQLRQGGAGIEEAETRG